MKIRAWAMGWLLLGSSAGMAGAAEWFVATNGSDAANGASWATAKQTIQAGIDAASSNDKVWVSNGVYATSGRVAAGTWTNRVVIDKPVTVLSFYGPEWTAIDGAGMRCAYVTNGAVLSGFTLTNGTTAGGMCGLSETDTIDHRGGGAYCETNATLTNCVLTGNWACWSGGGANGGTLNDCELIANVCAMFGGGAGASVLNRCRLQENHSDQNGGGTWYCQISDCELIENQASAGGGAYASTLDGCLLENNYGGSMGGGALQCMLSRCHVTGNLSRMEGGGANLCTLYNCLLDGNRAESTWGEETSGGGAKDSTLINCTVVSNTGFWGGGVRGGTMINCIVYGNTATNSSNWHDGAFTNCCTTPLPAGTSNVTNDPRFVDSGAGDYRLAAGSPCIEAGENAFAIGLRDLDGNPRIVNAMVDMGAYEYQDGTHLVIAPTATNLDSGASSGHEIEVLASVSWTAATNVSWLSVTSGGSGTTNGMVHFSAATNGITGARTGAVIVAGGGLSRTCTVVQAAFVPVLAVSPASVNAESGGASGLALSVTANVAWTAATNAPWLAISSGASGTTNGTVLFDVAANAGAARTGAIVVAGGGLSRTCTVVQAAFVPVLAVSPAGVNAGSGGASGLALSVTANVAWTAATNAPWLAISSGDSGTTNGAVLFDVAANADAARTGAVIVAGSGLARTCTVVQVKSSALAATWHVATNGNNAAAGTNWATAKQTIQAAVDAAEAGDVVWVSNGIYATGGRPANGGTLPNRVVIDKSLTVQSVNGSEETIIQGAGPIGDAAVRCVYVGPNVVLSGFTLTDGNTRNGMLDDVDNKGGGAWCSDASGMLIDCHLSGNGADFGGGAWGGTLNQCVLSDNYGNMYGGGAWEATLNNCLLVSNGGEQGGGAGACALNDCTVISNDAAQAAGGCSSCTLVRCRVERNGNMYIYGGGLLACTAYNCVVAGNSGHSGGGAAAESILRNCTLVGNQAHYGGGIMDCTLTNCIVYGNTADMSGPNYYGGSFNTSCTTPDPGGTGNVTNDPQFVDAAAGNYRLAAGSPCINAGDNAAAAGATDLDGSPRIVFGTVDMGAYEFLYQHVAPGGSDGADGISWATAKQTIQAAVDVTTNGCIVLVTNGVYATGGRTVNDSVLTNRVAIDRPIIVQSVNGPEVTIIRGMAPTHYARCAYVGSNAVLTGFTLTNGLASGSDDRYGGGAFIAGGSVEHCVISGNYAWEGAGAYIAGAGTLSYCSVIGNSAGDTGGGGGIFSSNAGQVVNCLIADNYAEWAPGVYGRGGGMELVNCTISGNSSFGGPAVATPTSTLWNCIVYSNNVDEGYQEIEGDPVVLHSCSPGLSGNGNVTNDPQFVDAAAGNYRLQATSPCLDAGDDDGVSWTEDLDGNPRIAFGAVDMGAYEAQLTGAGTWFGAITNGQTGDLDCVAGDGVPNLLKYATGGSPRISDDNVLLGWPLDGARPALTFHRNPSATDVWLVVEGTDRMTNGAAWRGVATNVGGSWLGATNVSESATGNPVECTVTDPVVLGTNRFLRLRVSRP